MTEHRIDELRDLLEILSDPAGVLASLIELSSCALALYEPGGHCVRANPAYRELFGTEPDPDVELAEDEVLGRSGVLFWLRRAFCGETVTTPTFWYEHERLPRADARRRIALSARAFALRGPDGNIELVAIVFRDETDSLLLEERRRIEEDDQPHRLLDEIERAGLERRSNEEQFRAIFEHSADGVMLTDDAGRILDINPAGCRLLGRRVQDVVGSRYWEHLDDTEHSIEEGVVHAKACVWRADGELRDLEMRSVADFLPHRHLTTFFDVTERNEEARRIERSERHLAASQRVAALGSWEVAIDGRDPTVNVMHFSEECFRLFGIERRSEDITPERALASVHPDDRAPFLEGLRLAARTGEPYAAEHRLVRPDGTIRLVRVRAQPMEMEQPAAREDEIAAIWIGTMQDSGCRSGEHAYLRLDGRILRNLRDEIDAFARAVCRDLDSGEDRTGHPNSRARSSAVDAQLLASHHASRTDRRRVPDGTRLFLSGR